MSISRISLALICVIFLWTSSAYAQWVNEPSGFQTTLDCPFNFKPTPSRDPAGCGIENFYNAGSITQDSSAPVSPPNLFKYPTVRLTDGTTVLPQAQIDIGNSALDEKLYGLARVVTLAASSHTWKIQYKVSASTTANSLHSKIFALDLNKFRNHTFAQTDAATALSSTDWATQIQTASITPDVQGDVWIGAYWSYDKNSSGNMANQRLQVDNSDAPANQTTAVYDYRGGIDGTDEEPMSITTMVTNMTAAAHTIDLDGSVDATTSTPEAETRTIWAFTMELPAVSSGGSKLMLMGVGR